MWPGLGCRHGDAAPVAAVCGHSGEDSSAHSRNCPKLRLWPPALPRRRRRRTRRCVQRWAATWGGSTCGRPRVRSCFCVKPFLFSVEGGAGSPRLEGDLLVGTSRAASTSRSALGTTGPAVGQTRSRVSSVGDRALVAGAPMTQTSRNRPADGRGACLRPSVSLLPWTPCRGRTRATQRLLTLGCRLGARRPSAQGGLLGHAGRTPAVAARNAHSPRPPGIAPSCGG